jgi:hypothetical protein
MIATQIVDLFQIWDLWQQEIFPERNRVNQQSVERNMQQLVEIWLPQPLNKLVFRRERAIK